ncbi:MAG: cytochrome c [Candidatus Acidiferrales bacterium]
MHHFGITKGLGFRIAVLISLLAFASAAFAQEVKKEAVKHTNPSSGAEMFKQYCAVCHGAGGKGDGPAAPALKQAPADLTTLAKRHDGKFPDDLVATVLRNGVKAPAHGTSDMPVWGPLFSKLNSDPAIVNMRITNLTSYVKSLQVK